MALRCVLVPTAPGINATRRLDTALKLCTDVGAHVRVLFMSPEPHGYLSAMPDIIRSAGVTVAGLEREFRTAAVVGRSELDRWCERAQVERHDIGDRMDGVFATWEEAVSDLEVLLATAGRVTDITVVDRPDVGAEFAERAFDTAVFSTGRPVLVVPPRVPDNPLRHIVVAWNGSLESARVIGQAMDLLHDAERVSIIHVDSQQVLGRLDDVGGERLHGVAFGVFDVALGAGPDVGDLRFGAHPAVAHLGECGVGAFGVGRRAAVQVVGGGLRLRLRAIAGVIGSCSVGFHVASPPRQDLDRRRQPTTMQRCRRGTGRFAWLRNL